MRSAAVLLLRRRQSALADSSCVLGCSKVLHTSLSCAESRNRSSSADGRDWRTEAIEPIMPDIYHTQDASLSSLNPLPKAAIHRAWNDKGHRPLSSRAEYDHSAVIDSEHAADEQLPGQPTVNAHQQPQQHQQQSQQQQQWRHSPVPFMPRSWGYSSMWDQQQPWPVPTQQPQWQEQEQHLQQQQQQAQPQPDVPMLPIYAVHLGFEVDLHAFHTAHTFKRTVATSNHLLIEVSHCCLLQASTSDTYPPVGLQGRAHNTLQQCALCSSLHWFVQTLHPVTGQSLLLSHYMLWILSTAFFWRA
eukprot:GHRR01014562.1.p1 GENE.GHRR01014562.1~~GHRR01014562.1.p1  ORF type:complete len:302 (+),score=84.22 GHRR01014562.1:228-1133(+)